MINNKLMIKYPVFCKENNMISLLKITIIEKNILMKLFVFIEKPGVSIN